MTRKDEELDMIASEDPDPGVRARADQSRLITSLKQQVCNPPLPDWLHQCAACFNFPLSVLPPPPQIFPPPYFLSFFPLQM